MMQDGERIPHMQRNRGAYTVSENNNTDASYDVKCNDNGFWWLRTPGRDAGSAAVVGIYGHVSDWGTSVDDSDYGGICPALHLNLSSVSVWSYAGTVCTDGTVNEIKPSVSTGGNTGNTTQQSGGQAQKAPAKQGTVLTAKDKKLKCKVTSSDASNPTVSITGATSKNRTVVTIPAAVTISGVTYKVTAISAKAFNGYKKLKTVTIGSNVKKIGSKAFLWLYFTDESNNRQKRDLYRK